MGQLVDDSTACRQKQGPTTTQIFSSKYSKYCVLSSYPVRERRSSSGGSRSRGPFEVDADVEADVLHLVDVKRASSLESTAQRRR